MDSLWCTALKSPQSRGKKGGILKKDVSAWVPNVNMAGNPCLSSRTHACVILNCGWLQTAFLWIISNLKSSWRKEQDCSAHSATELWCLGSDLLLGENVSGDLQPLPWLLQAGSTAVVFSIWWSLCKHCCTLWMCTHEWTKGLLYRRHQRKTTKRWEPNQGQFQQLSSTDSWGLCLVWLLAQIHPESTKYKGWPRRGYIFYGKAS